MELAELLLDTNESLLRAQDKLQAVPLDYAHPSTWKAWAVFLTRHAGKWWPLLRSPKADASDTAQVALKPPEVAAASPCAVNGGAARSTAPSAALQRSASIPAAAAAASGDPTASTAAKRARHGGTLSPATRHAGGFHLSLTGSGHEACTADIFGHEHQPHISGLPPAPALKLDKLPPPGQVQLLGEIDDSDDEDVQLGGGGLGQAGACDSLSVLSSAPNPASSSGMW